ARSRPPRGRPSRGARAGGSSARSRRGRSRGRRACNPLSQPGKMDVMPLVEITLVEGRTPEQLRTLISRLTAAVVDSVGSPKENVRVVLRETPATNWAAGAVTLR